MSNHSVIEHRANYHYAKLEEDYIQVCSRGKQYPHCKAFILSILEHWMNDKLNKGQSEYVYMTYPQWIDAMYGLFRRNHIIAALAELAEEKLILKRPCRLQGKDTYEYSLNVPVVQARLKAIPEKTEKYTRPNLNAFKFKREQKQTHPNLNANTRPNLNEDASKFGHNIDTITDLQSNITSQERESTPAPESDTTFSPPSVGDARAFSSSGEIDEVMIRGVIAQSSLSSEVEITEEFIQRTIDAFKQSVLVELRARPGLSEHPDDQLPGKSEIETPSQQGDIHAQPAFPHSFSSSDTDSPMGSGSHQRGNQTQKTVQASDGGNTTSTRRDVALTEGDRDVILDTSGRLPAVASVGDAGKDAERDLRPDGEIDNTFSEKADSADEETVKVPAVSKQVESAPADHSAVTPCGAMVTPDVPPSGVLPTTKGKGKKAAEPAKPEFTPEGEALYQDWCSLFHVKIPRTKAIILAANDLYEPIAYWSGKLSISRAEVLKNIMNWQYKNNANYYGEGRGVKLFDVQRDIEGWISAAERKLARDALKVVPAREDKSGQFNMGPIVLESHRKGGLRGKVATSAH